MKAINVLIRNVPDDIDTDWLLEQLAYAYEKFPQKEIDYVDIEFLEERPE